MLRSSEAFGLQHVHVVNPHGDRYRATRAVSSGAERWLSVRRWSATRDCFATLREEGFRVVVADARPGPRPATPLAELDLSQPTAVVLGNEHAGISAEALAAADERFVIPMAGFVESLNVSVAAAVAVHSLRQRIPAPFATPVRVSFVLGTGGWHTLNLLATPHNVSWEQSPAELEYLEAEFAVRSILKAHGTPTEWTAPAGAVDLVAALVRSAVVQ